ncbi:uncharacterized protein LOC113237418 [Hyposmocoma kahamanoa]|uniref:uncharacterized protein LOC113237418 n=1 Tax=Hyposmocoma kahamanoa TaxID=1477025 RepID=UPI000E6D7DAA|nr:uncharacterized protein LOC113237418 [Hyposmocoma kahamanoa]
MLHDDSLKFQDRIRKMEGNLKSSSDNVRALRRVNVALSEELHALRRVCAALDEQCRAAALRATFKDEIIREMRRQLKQAKAKLKETENSSTKNPNLDQKLRSEVSYSSLPVAVRSQPRRTRSPEESVYPLHDSDDCHSPRLDGSGDDCL